MEKLLNYEEIIARNIFTSPSQLNTTNATVNLTVGTIINLETYEEDANYVIPPRGMALIISEEEMSIPDGVIGYTTVKNGLSLKGIMAVNIGIVDNGWSGPISSILINFGDKDFKLKAGDVFLRMTFHEFTVPTAPAKNQALLSFTKKQYISQRKLDARAYLSDTFLVLNQVKKQIRKQVINAIWKQIGWVSLVIAILAFVISVVVYVFNYSKDVIEYYDRMDSSNEIKMINSRIDSVLKASEQKEKLYLDEIKNLNITIKAIQRKDSLETIKKSSLTK